MKTFRLLAILLAAVALLAPPAAAKDWTLLGERHVNDRLDHDTIVVTGERGTFTALKIRVRRAAVAFHDVKVHFRNGGVQDVEMRDRIPAGGESRVLDLPGGERVIEKIEFWYDAKTLGRRGARVEVWGRR